MYMNKDTRIERENSIIHAYFKSVLVNEKIILKVLPSNQFHFFHRHNNSQQRQQQLGNSDYYGILHKNLSVVFFMNMSIEFPTEIHSNF